MKTRFTLAAATTIGLLLASHSIGAEEKLIIRVTPNVSSAPSTVVVKATVPRSPDNRLLRIEAESETFFRSSDVELDGDKAPLITEIRFPNLPGGEYTVEGVLVNNVGQETIVRRTVIVLSRFGEPPQ
jgi:hypothetical protein